MPGLNDLHTHLESEAMAKAMDANFGPIPFDALTTAYKRYGITGLRLMSGSPDVLAWRKETALDQPLVILSGPMLSGIPAVIPEPVTQIVETPEAARAAVRRQAESGYDFIKLRANVSAEVHAAIIEEAKSQGLNVDGHLPYALSIDEVLRSGQKGVAHLFELAWAIEAGHASEEDVIAALLNCRCYVSSTIAVTKNIHEQQEDFERMLNRPEVAYMHPLMLETFWSREMNPNLNNAQIPRGGFFLSILAASQKFAVNLQSAGVPVLVGSDALNPMLVHGTSFHDELDILVEGGMSTYHVLRSATATPSENVPGFEAVGVVAAGRRANLLITDIDPVADHHTLRDPAWVIMNGEAIDRAALIAAYENSVEAWTD